MQRIIPMLVFSGLSFGANAASIVSWGNDDYNQVSITPAEGGA